jgi:hypothetical protein
MNRVPLRLIGLLLFLTLSAAAQSVPAPQDVLGWTPGDDRKLASWSQVVTYFKRLDAASDRLQFAEIGKTTMGAPFVYVTISSPANLKNLEKYKQINAKLADPRTFRSNDKAAKLLIAQGKTIVMITCGVHSTEVGSYLSSMLIAHRLASSSEPEIKKILDNTIVILVPSLNPDGVDIVNNWYQKTLGTKFEGTEPPELYHKYVGHDDNRDWYAFTQVETQLTVDKLHNVWHPQIVHDIHQQGANGSRLFLPPYMEPVEPNVPKQLVEGYTELGNYMAADLRKQGLQGITTNSTYDAWTPARAYSHYHGGVRILSETASVRLATPITVKFEDLRPGEHYDPRKEAPNFGPVWLGGEWHIRNITEYMTKAAFSLLTHAADNRVQWLNRFYSVGKDAVRPRKAGELFGYIFPDQYDDRIERILQRGGVEIQQAQAFTLNGRSYPDNTRIVRLDQPYGMFAKALLENQEYPHLLNENGTPIPPYDVTAHTLPLLIGEKVEPVTAPFTYRRSPRTVGHLKPIPECIIITNTAIYRSSVPSMDEGWTRWVTGRTQCEYAKATEKNIRDNSLFADRSEFRRVKRIIFPDQTTNQILNGYAKGAMPDEYTGGLGKEGVDNLRKFVEEGGELIFLNRASNFAIDQFKLPLKDVTQGVPRRDFYIPGSILRTELDTTHKIARRMPAESIAWFEGSPAFDVTTTEPGQVSVVARYPSDPKKVLLSGWALGTERIAGKAALVEVKMGNGKFILFGFRPQYRGQSEATYPLLFNAISNY